MTHRNVPLVPALSGIVAIVLPFVAQAFSGGSGSPDLPASRAKIETWLASQNVTPAHVAGGVVELIGILMLIVFAATLWSVLRSADSEDGIASATAFGAGLVAAAIKLASFPAAFAAIWRHDQGISPQLAAALVDMNNVSFVLMWTLFAVMIAAAATVIFRSGVLPRWLGWLGAVAATISIVSAPAAAHVPPLGVMLAFIWIVATSVVLTRRALRREPKAVAVAA
jgi:uncharacterized protein DUF4386